MLPRKVVAQGFLHFAFSSTTKCCSLPKRYLHLDPSLQTLLRDIDMSLKNTQDSLRKLKELEVVSAPGPSDIHSLPSEEWTPMDMNDHIHEMHGSSRKSPAALFGSNRIGAIVVPQELCSAINTIISDSHKPLLHSDAKRLFVSTEIGEEDVWDTHYDKVYHTRRQAAQHAVRDGTAFASVALPAHYSAIVSVLHHVKLRLGPSWSVERVIDWGAGTGSGLWASIYSFQSDIPHIVNEGCDPTTAHSSIRSYIGIDKRDGLVSIGKRLVNIISADNIQVSWKNTSKEVGMQEIAENAIALSAFLLTTLPTASAQKAVVEEMWDSGADTLILIDHDTPEGFKAIARAREHILELSRHETNSHGNFRNSGCHVLAPCPHDQQCPLLHSGGTPLVCGFSQRLQRPAFLQRTKHSGVGHEDIRYSYVVLRRGARPNPVETNVGRVGGIGLRVLTKELQNIPVKELELHVDDRTSPPAPISENLSLDINPALSGTEIQDQLRQDAYQWPRLIFPPLKKSGHIVLDACTSGGKIMRLTIPRSQGKQPYYDARKANWGDIFPHPPKNAPQERYQPKTHRGRPAPGDDIGKRKGPHRKREYASYNSIAEQMKEQKKLSKRDYARIHDDKIWYRTS